MTVNELLNAYEANFVSQIISQSRTKSACDHIRQALGSKPAERLGDAEIARYREVRVRAGYSGSTVNRELVVLASAVKKVLCRDLRFKRSPEKRNETFATLEQVQAIIRHCDDFRTAAFVRLLFLTGQRKDAIIRLKRSQLVNGIIEFAQDGNVMAQRRKARARTPITSDIRDLLDELENRYGRTEYVIPGPRGFGWCKQMSVWFREAAEAAGCPQITPHTIRHGVATILLDSGTSLLEVSKLIGHASLATTERVYWHDKPEFIKNSVSKLGGMI